MAPVSVGVCLAQVMRRQGHGVIVALSSVAGERVRRSNFAYGVDQGRHGRVLPRARRGAARPGARVLVVRPGFVRTKMTDGRRPAPLAVGPDDVAKAVAEAIVSQRRVVWVPRRVRAVSAVLRALPGPAFRRLPM